MVKEKENTVNLKDLFYDMQNDFIAQLITSTNLISHSPSKGDVTEEKWRNWLKNYLPKRYAIDKAFVIDCNGLISDQIDIVIYDNHFSPFIFVQNSVKYIPAESVYCILEVKQVINKENYNYAINKARSVEKLTRTSSSVVHIEGVSRPKKLFNIITGILVTNTEWSEGIDSTPFHSLVNTHPLDIGCSLNDKSFSTDVDSNGSTILNISTREESLIFFFLKLLQKLSKLGSVPAMSLEEYSKAIDSDF